MSVSHHCSCCGCDVEPYSRWTCQDCCSGPAASWFLCQGCAGRRNFLPGDRDGPGGKRRRLEDESSQLCWDWSHRFAPVLPANGWLILAPGPEAGKMGRRRRFVKSYLPAQAPPCVAWIAVRSDPAQAAAVAAAAAAAARKPAAGGPGSALASTSSAAGAAAADTRSCMEREEGAKTDWAVHNSLGTCSAAVAQQIGKRWGLTAGKWMVFVDGSNEGAIWPAVAKAVYEDGLCHSAKIAAGPLTKWRGAGKARRVICIYTDDFSDREDVMRVHRGLKAVLREAMPEHKLGTISYKPDIYTHLGIYYQNEWKVKPTLYSAKM